MPGRQSRIADFPTVPSVSPALHASDSNGQIDRDRVALAVASHVARSPSAP